MKPLALLLILAGLSLQAHAAHEEGSTNLSSVASASAEDRAYYEQARWSSDNLTNGSRAEAAEFVEGVFRQGPEKSRKEPQKSALGGNIK